jgi:predicted transcriptional regulator of viral defense system
VTVLESEYYFVKLARRKFFGWEELGIEDRTVRISNPEKTVADCLDHPEHCGGIEQVARAIYFSHDEIKLARVVQYARRMDNSTIMKRLGHILDATGLFDKYERLFIGYRPSAGFSKLDALSPRFGKHNARWGLLINYRLDPEGWRY